MSENSAKILENSIELSRAWYEFMGVCRPEYELRKRFDELSRVAPNETQEETDRRIRRTEIKTQNLRLDFLAEIRNGNFLVFGRDVTNQIDSPFIELPNSLFEEADPSLHIDWNLSHISIHGRKIVDICAFFKSDQTAISGHKKKMGRPTAEGIENAIRELMCDPEFNHLTRDAQCDRVRECLFGNEVDHVNPPKGYKDGAIKSRLRQLLSS